MKGKVTRYSPLLRKSDTTVDFVTNTSLWNGLYIGVFPKVTILNIFKCFDNNIWKCNQKQAYKKSKMNISDFRESTTICQTVTTKMNRNSIETRVLLQTQTTKLHCARICCFTNWQISITNESIQSNNCQGSHVPSLCCIVKAVETILGTKTLLSYKPLLDSN